MMTVGCILKHCLTKSLLPLLMLVSLAAWAEEQFVLIDVKKIDDIFHYSTLNQDGTTSEFRRRNLNGVVDTVTQHTNDENHGHGDDYVLWRDYLSKPHPTVNTLKTYFLQASNEFGVPVEILEAIGQIESNWTHIGPSIDKGWGIMHLVQNEYVDTLNEAARLLNVDQQILKDDAQQNIRGAAALIALYAGEARKSFTKLEDWLGAVAQFSGLFDSDLQKMQARNYYKKIKAGGVSSTLWGEQIVLNPNPTVEIPPDPQLTRRNSTSVDYAGAIPSFITPCSTSNPPTSNCTQASNRNIKAWVNHWVGMGTALGAIDQFKRNPGAGTSAHFVVSKDGEIYQVVPVKDIAWHAGNWDYNVISIGVEHEVTIGGMSNGIAWNTAWTEPLLRASAKMAKYFIDLYGIPQNHPTSATLNGGIFGHSQIKSTSCPGTFPWDTWMSYLSSSSTNLTYFDGAGSLISPSQSGFGANTDIANMHANPGRTSTAVFQFLNSSDQCHHVDISSSLSEAIIQVKNWSDHEVLTAYKGTLPISVLNKGTWTVVAVTSTQPLTTDYVSVRAKCKTSSDPLTSSYHNRTALDMKLIPLDSDYYWTGTGSIMSFLGSGTGKTSDIVPTFYSHKSLSSFQWYASSSCSKLKISGSGRSGSTSLYGDNEVAIKNWSRNKDGWGGNLCSSLPCTISRPNSIDDFYIVKVKTNANATGGSLSAECTN
jgi:hypothetical protein